ncbi:DUF2141 domain-containing protein [Dyadobacter sp. CY345]|uniref:DUF2141 domain-containing protein n=1 Tax=Dyadobacter sp. CY345 TaxID=2909335 RepID=UPI001F22ABDA|nr:DUF2141 domain-containing protein [Dyadobacter sp. CY345]MCF2446472.1 DUF2141 domain-containing protein [Dyadobacter sp. CY345]
MTFPQTGFCTLLLTLGYLTSYGQSSNQTVNISNIKSNKGNIMIGWYNSEASYNERNNPIFKKLVPVNQQREITITFDDVPAGKYAISLFLDENGNKKMDTNFLGIPKEQYGFSNNIIPATRAANFGEAAFELKDKPTKISIRLK